MVARGGESVSSVFNNEVENDKGDENGTDYPQYLHTEYYGVMVCGPGRLDDAFPLTQPLCIPGFEP
jgi:hypothetical protein